MADEVFGMICIYKIGKKQIGFSFQTRILPHDPKHKINKYYNQWIGIFFFYFRITITFDRKCKRNIT